ncbi:MAG: DUF3284 domain-containing protein [Traorella sp.]
MKLNISQQQFFDYLIQSLLIDIFKHTNEIKIQEELKQGFCYQKIIKDNKGNKYQSLVEIIKLNDFQYQSQITTGSNINIISYEYKQDNTNMITYQEEYDNPHPLKKYNHQFVSFCLSPFYRKQIKKMLLNMEMHIQRSQL